MSSRGVLGSNDVSYHCSPNEKEISPGKDAGKHAERISEGASLLASTFGVGFIDWFNA
jgi:hypothetical protein